MLKKILALLLVLSLLLSLSACAADTGGTGLFRTKDTLKVCIDSLNDPSSVKMYMYDFMYSFTQVTGIENVEFEYLPTSGVERETAIQRIRTELMSGSGPDVFLVKCTSADFALFPYPEKVMEAGFFLPLDEYMENSTQYTEWDKQNQVVLAAGRNDEGQQIIPLSYHCPIQVHDKAKLDVEKPDHPLTFGEILSDPELTSLYSEFYNCQNIYLDNGENFYSIWPGQFSYIPGKLADFETEELLFTEEELLSTVEQIFSLPLDKDVADTEYTEVYGPSYLPQLAQPFTLLPLYSMDGGVAVTIDSIAAINRNTKMPEEAYAFLDFFMREKTQLTSFVYHAFAGVGIPLFDDVYKEGYAYNGRTLTNEAYAEFADLKSQITAANFYDDLSNDLAQMMKACWETNKEGLPLDDIVHETYELMQRKVKE